MMQDTQEHLQRCMSLCPLFVCVWLHCRAESRNSDSSFLAGFVMGGVVFGALGFLLAPQVCCTGCTVVDMQQTDW
jgi:hypothetical protein